MNQIKISKIFKWLQKSKKPIKVLQGGSGSSKTYSILQTLIFKALTVWENKTIDIIRRTLPALKMSAMKDFEDILKDMGIFEMVQHNISQNTYMIGSNKFQFYSTDDEKKMRGPRRDIVYFNEVLELKRIDVYQILMRRNGEVYMDFNPSEESHWVYDEILPREDVDFLVSTHLDNPFLSKHARDEIVGLKNKDPNLYRIYCRGERGISKSTVFYNVNYFDGKYELFEGEELFGLDFGYNDPTCLMRVKYHERGILFDQLIYKTNLTSKMIIAQMDKLLMEGKLTKNSTIFCDSARPEIIEELRAEGYNVHSVKKGPDSVLRGINFFQRHNLYFTHESTESYKEFRGYKWKVASDETLLEEPIGLNDHSIDAGRYAVSEKSKNRKAIGVA